jgi:hypothetical protein
MESSKFALRGNHDQIDSYSDKKKRFRRLQLLDEAPIAEKSVTQFSR